MGTPLVGILAIHRSDFTLLRKGLELLRVLGIPYEFELVAPHRAPEQVTGWVDDLARRGAEAFIVGAGSMPALPALVATSTLLPVIALPLDATPGRGAELLLAASQVPTGAPVAVVGVNASDSAAYLVARILAARHPRIHRALEHHVNALGVKTDSTRADLIGEFPDLADPEVTTLPDPRAIAEGNETEPGPSTNPPDRPTKRMARKDQGTPAPREIIGSSATTIPSALRDEIDTPEPQEPLPPASSRAAARRAAAAESAQATPQIPRPAPRRGIRAEHTTIDETTESGDGSATGAPAPGKSPAIASPGAGSGSDAAAPHANTIPLHEIPTPPGDNPPTPPQPYPGEAITPVGTPGIANAKASAGAAEMIASPDTPASPAPKRASPLPIGRREGAPPPPPPPPRPDRTVRRPLADRLFRIDPMKPDVDVIEHAMLTLLEGGIVATPTDTVYALAVDATNAAAVERLYRLKGMDRQKALAILVHNTQMLSRLITRIPERVGTLTDEFWPGRLTVIFPKPPGALSGASPAATIGVRIPDHNTVLALISMVARPLATTSVTPRGGGERFTSAKDVIEHYGDELDCIIDAGETPAAAPSTVLSVVRSPYEILREGAITRENLKVILGDLLKDAPAGTK